MQAYEAAYEEEGKGDSHQMWAIEAICQEMSSPVFPDLVPVTFGFAASAVLRYIDSSIGGALGNAD